MNAKTLKQLRKSAGYQHPGQTPGVMDFPGIARMVTHPVYATRRTVKTTYVKLPGDPNWTKIKTAVTSMVLDNRAKPVIEMERNPNYGLPIMVEEMQPDEDTGAVKKVMVSTGVIDRQMFRVKTQVVPTSKPGRLRDTEPKGIYRRLKRLMRRGVLLQVGGTAEKLQAKLAPAGAA